MKVCTYCKNEKDISSFRQRSKRGYTWIQGKCKDCEAFEEKQRKIKQKQFYGNCEWYKEKQKLRHKLQYQKAKDRQSAKNKEIRKQPNNQILLNQRKYNKNHQDKIKKQHIPVARKSFIKQRDLLTNSYIITMIKQRTNLKKEDILKYPELIETYKLIIKTKRLCKTLKT